MFYASLVCSHHIKYFNIIPRYIQLIEVITLLPEVAQGHKCLTEFKNVSLQMLFQNPPYILLDMYTPPTS